MRGLWPRPFDLISVAHVAYICTYHSSNETLITGPWFLFSHNFYHINVPKRDSNLGPNACYIAVESYHAPHNIILLKIIKLLSYSLVAVCWAGQSLTAVRAPGITAELTRRAKTDGTPILGNFHIGQTIRGPMMNNWKSQAMYQLSPMHILEKNNLIIANGRTKNLC